MCIRDSTKFHGQVYILSKDEGGRHTPFFNNYRPQFYFSPTDVTGVISLPEGVEMCMPGDNVEMDVELITPCLLYTSPGPAGGGGVVWCCPLCRPTGACHFRVPVISSL